LGSEQITRGRSYSGKGNSTKSGEVLVLNFRALKQLMTEQLDDRDASFVQPLRITNAVAESGIVLGAAAAATRARVWTSVQQERVKRFGRNGLVEKPRRAHAAQLAVAQHMLSLTADQ
tara:strand:+ start:249 stop:602 length:354 start_codon:yes stop_codon:yes gene_type:complete